MRTSRPRIAPLEKPEWTREQEDLLTPLVQEGGLLLNIWKTMARHPSSMRSFMGWFEYVLGRGACAAPGKGNTLPARERELLILRTGWLCRSGYEWAAHLRVGRRSGVTEAEIERLRVGSTAPGWTDADRTLVRVAEELYADRFVSDPVWASLRAHFSERQCMDAVYTVAQYTQVALVVNAFGVQLDPGWPLDDGDRKALVSGS
jgi:4-carboxymuconolactone decarboxylase